MGKIPLEEIGKKKCGRKVCLKDYGIPCDEDEACSHNQYEKEIEELAMLIDPDHPEHKRHAMLLLRSMIREHGEHKVNQMFEFMRMGRAMCAPPVREIQETKSKEKESKEPIEIGKDTQVRFRLDMATIAIIISSMVSASMYFYNQGKAEGAASNSGKAEVSKTIEYNATILNRLQDSIARENGGDKKRHGPLLEEISNLNEDEKRILREYLNATHKRHGGGNRGDLENDY